MAFFLSTEINEDGLTIVLSPVQLAAVMQGATLTQPETATGRFMNRVFGGLQLVGAALELVGASALLVTPEPSGLTKAGGVVLAANGLDNAATGAIQVWTGQEQTTWTAQATAAAARSLGADPDTADEIGMAVNIAVPFVVAGGFMAARAAAIRAGTIDLAAEEAAGGHTIARHVGKDEAFLRNRLATEPKITGAGSFTNLAKAEKFVSKAMSASAKDIQAWASAANATNSRPLVLIYDAQAVVGKTIPRATNILQEATKLRVVLRKTSVAQKIYFVLTAFPIP